MNITKLFKFFIEISPEGDKSVNKNRNQAREFGKAYSGKSGNGATGDFRRITVFKFYSASFVSLPRQRRNKIF